MIFRYRDAYYMFDEDLLLLNSANLYGKQREELMSALDKLVDKIEKKDNKNKEVKNEMELEEKY